MDGPGGQCGTGGRRAELLLEEKLVTDQHSLFTRQVGQHQGHRLHPPDQTAQVGLAPVEVAACEVHACQHVAYLSAVRCVGCHPVAAR